MGFSEGAINAILAIKDEMAALDKEGTLSKEDRKIFWNRIRNIMDWNIESSLINHL